MPTYRKLAAILAADVVGYSRLMSDDEQATVSTLQAYRQIFIQRVADHGGRVVDFPGDALLAEFPSALEAVQCSSEIQAQIAKRNAQLADHRKMLFRIGINLGDVIQEEGALYGDGVNIAARLEALCAEGGICISGSVFDQVEGKLPFAFTSMGEQQVKNIPKPVRAYMVRPESESHASTSKTARRGNGKWRSRVILAVFSLLIVCALAFLVLREHFSGRQRESDLVLAIPKGPSIAVLPFSNFSGDPKQEALADGISEDIITALSRFPDLFVIALNSTFKYKGKTEDIRGIGKDLGAMYVLEGSVQGSGGRLRITAQLIDSRTGAHVWADAFDREATGAKLLDMQEEITEHVAAQIAGGYGVLSRLGIEKAQGARPSDMDAYTCVLKARAYYRVFAQPEHLEARDCLEAVVQKYPNYAEGWAWLSLMYLDEFRYDYNRSPSRPHPIDTALECAERAARLAPNEQDTQHALAKIHYFRHELDEFFTYADKALRLNPNNAQALADLGFFTAFAGRWERGVPMVRKAAALDPNHPGWYHFVFFYDHYRKQEYPEALEEALKVNTPGLFFHYVVHIAAYGQLGRKDEAQKYVSALLKAYPDIPHHLREEYRKYNFAPDLIEHIVQGLAKGGLVIPDDKA